MAYHCLGLCHTAEPKGPLSTLACASERPLFTTFGREEGVERINQLKVSLPDLPPHLAPFIFQYLEPGLFSIVFRSFFLLCSPKRYHLFTGAIFSVRFHIDRRRLVFLAITWVTPPQPPFQARFASVAIRPAADIRTSNVCLSRALTLYTSTYEPSAP